MGEGAAVVVLALVCLLNCRSGNIWLFSAFFVGIAVLLGFLYHCSTVLSSATVHFSSGKFLSFITCTFSLSMS